MMEQASPEEIPNRVPHDIFRVGYEICVAEGVFQHPANIIEKGLDFRHEIEYIIFDHGVGA
jgi:hypothetical protein